MQNNYKYKIDINHAIEQFTSSLKEQGFILNEPIKANGKLQRCAVDNDRANEKSGAYIFYPDGFPAGFIQNFRTGYNSKWKYTFDKEYSKNTQENHNFNAERNFVNQKRDFSQEYQKTAEKLLKEFKNCNFVETNHPYLEKKQIQLHKLRQDNYGNLLIPLMDVNQKFWSVARITKNGEKFIGVIRSKAEKEQGIEYPAKKKGCFFTQVPLEKHKEFNICEGFATAMTIQELMQKPTIMAVDAGNLKNVVESLVSKFPNKTINIFADNDLKNENKGLINAGIKAAKEVQESFKNVNVIIPKLSEADIKEGLSDFNDLKCKYGDDYTIKQIKSQIKQDLDISF